MTIQQMLERKKELGYSYSMIAELSGVPAATVQKVLGGVTKAPRYETICALEKVFAETLTDDKSAEGTEQKSLYDSEALIPGSIKDSSAAYNVSVPKKPGEFTLDDYYALPAEHRAELIDGVFYDMSAPQVIHQLLAGLIYYDLQAYISGNKGPCLPLISPVDVQLDMDNRTMLEPDLMILCDRKKLRKSRIYGAPDLVMEILSPGTRKKDMGIKMHKYIESGVREYWIIWPDKQRVVTYSFEDDSDYIPNIYTFENKVPVGIWSGKHEVDFPGILRQISFMYEEEASENGVDS